MSESSEKANEKKGGRRAPIVVAILVALTGAAVAFRDKLDLPEFWKPAAKGTTTAEVVPAAREKSPTSGDVPLLPELQPAPPKPGEQGFDIARISPEGVSVFAGHAAPNSTIAVVVDGVRVGATKVDENGEWTLSTEHKITSADPKLTIETVPEGTKVAAVEAPAAAKKPDVAAVAAKVQKPPAVEPAQRGTPKSAEQVTTGMIQNLERLVEEARKEEKAAQAAPPVAAETTKHPPESARLEAAPKKVAAAEVPAASPNRASDAQVATPAIIPVPITFEYRTSNFTTDGRRAALLLSEYLKLKRSREVALTGHADERGTDELNLNLSQERLDAVAALLRETGFNGQINLQPKGKREPFAGVERSQYSQDALYQLDRRVELRVAQ